MEEMSTEQVFAELLKMKAGDEKVFLFDHPMQRGELSVLAVRVSNARNDKTTISFRRDDRKVYASCRHIPDSNKGW